jgi:hypothetical protein
MRKNVVCFKSANEKPPGSHLPAVFPHKGGSQQTEQVFSPQVPRPFPKTIIRMIMIQITGMLILPKFKPHICIRSL